MLGGWGVEDSVIEDRQSHSHRDSYRKLGDSPSGGGGGGGVVDTDRPPGQGDNGTARVGRGRLVGGISPGALSRRGDRQEW